MDINTRLKKLWDDGYTKEFGESGVFAKERFLDEFFCSPDGRYTFRKVFNPGRWSYFKAQRNRDLSGKVQHDSDCIFAGEHGITKDNAASNGTIGLNHVFIRPNAKPPCEYNFMLITYEHTRDFSYGVLEEIIALSEIFDGTLTYSTVGSGASVPEHAHFQSFPLVFPVITQAGYRPIMQSEGMSMHEIIFPAYAVCITGERKAVTDQTFRVTRSIFPEETDEPLVAYNLVIYKGEVYIFPRLKVIPDEFQEWRFGATEISGFFCNRSEEIFKSLDYSMVKNIMGYVTFNDAERMSEAEKDKLAYFKDVVMGKR